MPLRALISAELALRDRAQLARLRSHIVGQGLQFGWAELLDLAHHDRVAATDARVALGLIRLQGDVQIVAMLAGNLRVDRSDRLAEIGAVA